VLKRDDAERAHLFDLAGSDGPIGRVVAGHRRDPAQRGAGPPSDGRRPSAGPERPCAYPCREQLCYACGCIGRGTEFLHILSSARGAKRSQFKSMRGQTLTRLSRTGASCPRLHQLLHPLSASPPIQHADPAPQEWIAGSGRLRRSSRGDQSLI
jgi:hypothetical protein